MTKITFYQDNNKRFTGFVSEGHSDYAEEGSDIVCAAVSALIINTINSVEQLTVDSPAVEEDPERAFIRFRLEEGSSAETQLLLRSLALGLAGIENNDNYSRHIDVIFEEV